MKHEIYIQWISASLDGELSPAQRTQLEQHLHSCPSCAQLYDQMSAQSHALRNLDCAFPSHLHQQILDHLPPQLPSRPSFPSWKTLAPLAACFILVVALGISLLSRPPAPTPSPASRSNLGLAPAAFSLPPDNLTLPGGDAVIHLTSPLSPQAQELVNHLEWISLEGGYVCCLADAQTTQTLLELLQQTGESYQQSIPATPDNSGTTAIVWPVG